MRHVEVHRGHVRGVAFAPDGRHLATAGNDGRVCLLRADTGEERASWGHSPFAEIAVAFNSDGGWLAFGGLSAAVGVVRVEPRPEEAWPGTPRFYWPPGNLTSPGHAATVSCVAYSPVEQVVYFGTGERFGRLEYGSVGCWEPPAVAQEWAVRLSGGIQHLAVRPDGKQLAVGTGWGWHYLDTTTRDVSKVMTQGRTAPAVAYSPDGGTLAVSQGKTVCLQTVATGKVFRLLQGHTSKVTTLAFTPDGQSLLSGSWDRTVRVWSPSTGQQKAALDWQRGKVQYVAVAPDGMTATAACDRGVVIWDLD